VYFVAVMAYLFKRKLGAAGNSDLRGMLPQFSFDILDGIEAYTRPAAKPIPGLGQLQFRSQRARGFRRSAERKAL
jgi:hypothetical protein